MVVLGNKGHFSRAKAWAESVSRTGFGALVHVVASEAEVEPLLLAHRHAPLQVYSSTAAQELASVRRATLVASTAHTRQLRSMTLPRPLGRERGRQTPVILATEALELAMPHGGSAAPLAQAAPLEEIFATSGVPGPDVAGALVGSPALFGGPSARTAPPALDIPVFGSRPEAPPSTLFSDSSDVSRC